jgi:hypothetical protein
MCPGGCAIQGNASGKSSKDELQEIPQTVASHELANCRKSARAVAVCCSLAGFVGELGSKPGFMDFLKFNVNMLPYGDAEPKRLTPYNLTYQTKCRLRALAASRSWMVSDDVIFNLNLPREEKIKSSPFSFKYVFDHVNLFGTVEPSINRRISDEELLKPIKDQQEFVEFFSLF